MTTIMVALLCLNSYLVLKSQDLIDTILQKVLLFEALKDTLSCKSLISVLDILAIEYDIDTLFANLKCRFQTYINEMQWSWNDNLKHRIMEEARQRHWLAVHNWPQPISPLLKEKIIKLFHKHTLSFVLKSVICTACSEEYYQAKCKCLTLADVNFEPLMCPDHLCLSEESVSDLS